MSTDDTTPADPADPYAGAPALDAERDALVLLAAELHDRRPLPGLRVLALRKAAWLDRGAMATGAAALRQQAEHAARELLALDRVFSLADGPTPDGDAPWDPDVRGYVRREYAAWLGRQDQDPAADGHQAWDRADFRCGTCGATITATTEAQYVRRVSEHRAAHTAAAPVLAYVVERMAPGIPEDRRGISYGVRPLPAGWDARALAEDIAQAARVRHSYTGALRCSVWAHQDQAPPRPDRPIPADARRFEFGAVPAAAGRGE